MYEEDKTVLSPREEPEKPETNEVPEVPEIPASEDATVISNEPLPLDIPVMEEVPAAPEIPAMDEIPVLEDIPSPDFEVDEGTSGEGDASRDWMAIAAIVAGILSLCGAVIAPLGCLVSTAGVVLGVLGLKSTKRTLAIIGLVAAGLGILLSLVFGVVWIGGLFFAESSF